ncbi:MAG: hypothetical protein ABIY48_11055 [Acidimicrobiales bacterium]
MATLVEDLDATITCPECGHVCAARMQSCTSCLALLRPPPDADVEDDIARMLSSGLRMHRPVGREPFAGGPGCTVLRLSPHGGLVVCGVDGLIEANLTGPGIRARPPLTCSTGGTLLFRLEAYEPADAAVVAIGADGAPLGTYLRHGGPLSLAIDIRDETSAPAGRLEPVRRGARFQVVETGGRLLGSAHCTDVEDEEWIDDQWSVTPTSSDLPVRPLAFVALAVAAKVLLGRPEPVRCREPRAAEPDDDADVLGPIGRRIIDGFLS